MNAVDPRMIAEQIRPAMTQLYVTYFRLASRSDLTGPQLTILTRLEDMGPARISDIARLEGIRMPTASNALHQLEVRGMVDRVRDPYDGRGVRVRLTALGRAELKRVGEERTELFTELLSHLSPEDLETTAKMVPVIQRLAQSYTAANEDQK
ncbi:MAG: MarR family transcriptional regulator [Corynebacterium sp.]|nr:MarR family transcriptional regulator [Corynebacterium sp.]